MTLRNLRFSRRTTLITNQFSGFIRTLKCIHSFIDFRYSGSSSTRSAVIVLETLDVILSEVGSPLNLDEDQLYAAGILNPVRRTGRNVHGAACRHCNLASVKRDFRLTGHDHPVFRALRVLLVTEALLRQDLDALDLVAVRFVEYGEVAPRTFVMCHLLNIHPVNFECNST